MNNLYHNTANSAVLGCDMTPGELVDIRDVSVDTGLSREERIAEFVRQIKNPRLFRCGKFTVRARFANNGVSLEDCLRGILR